MSSHYSFGFSAFRDAGSTLYGLKFVEILFFGVQGKLSYVTYLIADNAPIHLITNVEGINLI